MGINKNEPDWLAAGEIDNAIEALKKKGPNAEAFFAKVIEKLKRLIPFYASIVVTNGTGKKRSLCGRVVEISFNEKDKGFEARILNDGYIGPGEKEFNLKIPLDNLLQIIFCKQAGGETEKEQLPVCEEVKQPAQVEKREEAEINLDQKGQFLPK